MLRNRDITRRNKANKALQASMYSNIASTTIKSLNKMTSHLVSHEESNQFGKKQEKLVNILSKCNTKMMDLFNESQESLSKHISKKYSTEQHNSIMNALMLNEDVTNIADISTYVYDEEIMSVYNELIECEQSECTYLLI